MQNISDSFLFLISEYNYSSPSFKYVGRDYHTNYSKDNIEIEIICEDMCTSIPYLSLRNNISKNSYDIFEVCDKLNILYDKNEYPRHQRLSEKNNFITYFLYQLLYKSELSKEFNLSLEQISKILKNNYQEIIDFVKRN